MTLRDGHVIALGAAVMLLAACSAQPPATAPNPSASAERAPRQGPSAVEDDRAAHPGDGIPDPDGRIAFGRITREDPLFSQVVALFAIDPDGSDEVRLTDGESAFPAWSPDGSRLAYTLGLQDGSWQVATMAADGSDIEVLTSGPGYHEVPSWSPDGTWLAYDYSPTLPSDPAFRTTLWRMDADGGNQQLLGNPDAYDIEPRISPDGRSILFQRLTDGGETSTLMVRDLTTGEETAFPAAGELAHHPTWSPDGQWIIYNVGQTSARRDQVEKIAPVGSGQPIVIFPGSDAVAGFKPVYSPEGSRILFGCRGLHGGTDDAACLMDAEGSDVEVLVDEAGAHENHFSWGRSTG